MSQEIAAEPPVERPHPLTMVTQAWILLVGAAWVGVQSLLTGEFSLNRLSWQVWIFLVILAFQLVEGIGKAWFTRFVATDSHFKIELRFIWQSSKRVTFSKIQQVDVSQPFAARLLGLAKLTIEVGANENYTVEFLSKARAEELRAYLLERASEARAADNAATERDDSQEVAAAPVLTAAPQARPGGETVVTAAPVLTAAPQARPGAETVVTASPLRLLFAGVASFYFLVAMLVAAGTLWAALNGGAWAIFFTAFFAIGAALYRTVVLNWNFTLSRTPGG